MIQKGGGKVTTMTTTTGQIHPEIQSFGERFSKDLPDLDSYRSCIEYTRQALPVLLLNRQLLVEIMQGVVSGEPYPDIRRPTMFDNELILYVHPARLFSLRLYLWGAGEFTYPHDHNAWGVIGTAMEGYEVTNFRRVDDGSMEGYAKLEEVARLNLKPGETAFTLPFDEGIHRTGNSGDKTIITLHLYGKSHSRGYLQGYDIVNNQVYRVFPPRLKKKTLASQALADMKA